jgi:pSer/pThr/pTyr-binding forkhead associated (FHA) protein
VAARDLPRLVTVASPNQDISRTHAQVRADGDDVLVTDLNSTNGMLMTDPGQPARRLRSGEPTPLLPGALVDLGDGVTFVLERDE